MIDIPKDQQTELSAAAPILRPVKVFHGPEGELPPDSWFEQNKLQILKVFQMTDLSFARMLVANMIFEAWNAPAFFEAEGGKPTEADRMFLIAWLQHYASIFGILSYDEIYTLRETAQKLERSIGDRQSAANLPREFVRRTFENHDKVYSKMVIKRTVQALKAQGKVIGIFHGSFDPPHVGHLASLLLFHQHCHCLLLAIDSNSYIQNVKAPARDPNRKSFSEHTRLSIIKHFPHLYDQLMVLPFEDLENIENGIVDFYKSLGIDIVFFSKVGVEDRLFEQRRNQVIHAGAIPFTEHLLTDLSFPSSTSLMQALREGLAIDSNLPF